MKAKIIVCGLALLLAWPALAQDMAGKVVVVVGQAFAKAEDDSQRRLSKGDAVFSGETISTYRHSYVNIEYTDEGRTLVGPDSQLRIAEYR